LAALLGKQRGLAVHIFDRNRDGVKPALAEDLGATYHVDFAELDALQPDIVLECTGSTAVVQEVFGRSGPSGIVCLASVTAPGHKAEIDLGQLNRSMVLDNDTIFGTVNANRAHYQLAAEALGRADRDWLGKLITRRVPLDHWAEALDRRKTDIKVVIDFAL
jgi:threonine dehydrogenase-like Zn-dependent dehydrogenase